MNAPDVDGFRDGVRDMLRQPDLTSDACLIVADAVDVLARAGAQAAKQPGAWEEVRAVAEALRALAPIYGKAPLPQPLVEATLACPPASHLWVHLTPPNDGRVYPSPARVQELLEALRLPRSHLTQMRWLTEEAQREHGKASPLGRLMALVRDAAEVLPP